MNRRSFLLGGGLIGVAAAAVAATIKASQPEGSVAICKDSHEPIEIYKKQVAIAIGNTNEPSRALVPCAKCGVLFALTIPKKS